MAKNLRALVLGAALALFAGGCENPGKAIPDANRYRRINGKIIYLKDGRFDVVHAKLYRDKTGRLYVESNQDPSDGAFTVLRTWNGDDVKEIR